MKKIISISLCLFFLFSISIPVSASAQTPARKTVRVGYFQYDGFYNQDDDGVKSGYGYDVLQKLRTFENWDYQYVGYDENTSWHEMFDLLEKGEIDILAPANYTAERDARFTYASLPMGSSSTIISVMPNNRLYRTDDYSNWDGVKVGMIAYNNKNNSFSDYAQKHGFSYQAVICDNASDLMEQLKSGKIDMTATSSLVQLPNVWTVDDFDPLGVYFITNKNNTELSQELNDGLTKLQKAQPNYQDELSQKYYGNIGGSIVQFSNDEQAFIDSEKEKQTVYYAAINPNRDPLSYCEAKQMKGLLTDISNEIFSRTGLNVKFKVFDSREQYYDAIDHHKVDVICDWTGSASKAENQGFVLLDSYYSSTTSRLVRRDYDSDGNRCAIAGNSISGWLQGRGYEFVNVDSVEGCSQAVKNGDADFTFSYTKCIQKMVYDDKTNSLMALAEDHELTDFAMAVNSSCNSMLCSVLQKSIESITTDDVYQISDDYSYYEPKTISIQDFMYQNPVLFSFLAFIIAALFFGIIILILVVRKKSFEAKNAIMLEAALQASEVATKEKNDFYSRMSHDMRTPMNGILGISELSMDETTPEVLHENMKKIHDSGEYLLGLINDTLDLQKIESGKLTLEPSVVSIHDLITSGAEAINQMAKKKNIDFRIVNSNANLDAYILVDSMRIKQIFINLLSNAVKFTPSGGTVELSIEVLERDGKKTHDRLMVTDTGLGISQEYIDHKMFQPFSQEHNELTDTYAGSGLGLSIVKSLVEMMGATITVESELGVGTRFTIDIDMESVDKKEVKELSVHNKDDQKTLIEKLYGSRILLAEDHPLNAEIAIKLLEKVGCNVVWAKNGEECVHFFEKSELHRFHAILMDIRMPEMDGLTAAKTIRNSSHADAKTIPIIAMTANAYQEDIEKSKEAGMNAHLAKPIDVHLLYKTISEQMRKEL